MNEFWLPTKSFGCSRSQGSQEPSKLPKREHAGAIGTAEQARRTAEADMQRAQRELAAARGRLEALAPLPAAPAGSPQVGQGLARSAPNRAARLHGAF